MAASLRSVLGHVGRVREAVLAAALPDPEEYLQLQRSSVLITSHHPSTAAAVFSVPLGTSDYEDCDHNRLLLADDAESALMRRAEGKLIEETKNTLDGPLNSNAVRLSWCRAWYTALLIIAAALALCLVVWLLVLSD